MSENPIPESSELAPVNEQCAELERQMSFLRVGLVIASITLTVFLAIQWKRSSTDLESIRAQAGQLSEMARQSRAAVEASIPKFAEFARTHPDFAPIAARYGIKPAATPAPAQLMSAPPAAQPKK